MHIFDFHSGPSVSPCCNMLVMALSLLSWFIVLWKVQYLIQPRWMVGLYL